MEIQRGALHSPLANKEDVNGHRANRRESKLSIKICVTGRWVANSRQPRVYRKQFENDNFSVVEGDSMLTPKSIIKSSLNGWTSKVKS